MSILMQLQVLRARFPTPPKGFATQPKPRSIGDMARGRQLIAGNLIFAGYFVNFSESHRSLWQNKQLSDAYSREIHSFSWLDDLAAVSDMPARDLAQSWVWSWIRLYCNGHRVGWQPDLVGRRLISCIQNAIFLLNGQKSSESKLFFRFLGQQTIFLKRAWQRSSSGLPRFEALCGLLYAGLSLEGMEHVIPTATKALAHECEHIISADGTTAGRNAEELLEIFTLLTWVAENLRQVGQLVPPVISQTLKQIAPSLRLLRHSDGRLPRFHGAGEIARGKLDHILAASGVRERTNDVFSMGYACLHAARTSLVIDADEVPDENISGLGQACTLAFELTSARQPIVVNCGNGFSFGPEKGGQARKTFMHSTLNVQGRDSTIFDLEGRKTAGIKKVSRDFWKTNDAFCVLSQHDGFVPAYGVTHSRQIDLTFNGREILGQDIVRAVSDHDKAFLADILSKQPEQSISYEIAFHIHPDLDIECEPAMSAVCILAPSGEEWIFRYAGIAQLDIRESVYYDRTRIEPRRSKQIVLKSTLTVENAEGSIGWSFLKGRDAAPPVSTEIPD